MKSKASRRSKLSRRKKNRNETTRTIKTIEKAEPNICSMCLKKYNDGSTLHPASCYQKNGPTSHRICSKCWFSKFALENADHSCPGCKKMPFEKRQVSNGKIIIIDD